MKKKNKNLFNPLNMCLKLIYYKKGIHLFIIYKKIDIISKINILDFKSLLILPS